MADKIRLPFEIDEDVAKAEGIHPAIIAAPTEKEFAKHRAKAEEIHEHVNSLLQTKPEWVDLEMSQRAVRVYSEAIEWLGKEKNFNAIGEEEALKRMKTALVNLAEAHTRLGNFQEAIDIAWNGIHLGARTVEHLQKATSYLVAINKSDEEWCNCEDTIIENSVEPGKKVFSGSGSSRTVSILPVRQVVDTVPSYKHNGEIVNIVRCNNCGTINAVPQNKVLPTTLDVKNSSHVELEKRQIASE